MTRRVFAILVSTFCFILALTGAVLAAAPEPSTEHLIICPESLEAEFARLAEHRSSAGIPSVVVTLEEAFATTSAGRDDAETLRKYIVAVHASTSLRFVLLGGDAGVVPHRVIHSTFYPVGTGTDLTTDLYFAALEGDWDGDGDGIFGEAFTSFQDTGDDADMGADIAVGRAPVSTTAQAARFVDAIIDYDKTPNATFHGSALFAAEVLFPSEWDGGNPQLDGAVYAQNAIARLLLHPTPVVTTRLYERTPPYPGAQTLNPASFLEAFNSGHHGTTFYFGHGYTQSLSCGTGRVELADIDGLLNAPNYGVFVGTTAAGAQFEQDCILEHLVTAPGGGAAAAIGFTNVVFPTTADVFVQRFVEQLAAASGVLLGEALMAAESGFVAGAMIDSGNRWALMTLCLFADPAMPFRVEEVPIPTEKTTVGGFKARF